MDCRPSRRPSPRNRTSSRPAALPTPRAAQDPSRAFGALWVLCLVGLLVAQVGWVGGVVLAEDGSGEHKVLSQDDFSSEATRSIWTWVREDKEGWRLEEGRLAIRTKGLLWGKENSQHNVLLHEALDSSDLSVAAELTVDAGLGLTHAYEHGGLIWYFDDDHWVTLTQLNHVQDQTQKIMLVHETGGRGQVPTAKAVPYTEQVVELRLEHRNHRFTGYYRAPGSTDWQKLGSIDFKHTATAPRIGIVAGQGDDADLNWVSFDNFRVLTLP